MSNLEVVFHVPPEIESGLLSGLLERVGGVIVDSATRRVVAWLRDGGGLDNVNDLVPSAAALFQHQAGTIALFTASGQVLNLALTGVTFAATLRRLDRLSQEVASLGQAMHAEFNRDRDMRFRIAIQAARDAFETTSTSQREQAARHAIDGLYEAREQFLADFGAALSAKRLEIAQHMLIRAMYAESSRIRCYLVNDEETLAKQRLAEDIPMFNEAARALVQAWLAPHPAAYLHIGISRDDLRRFIQVQRWLRDEQAVTPAEHEAFFLTLLDDLRGDFWKPAIIDGPAPDLAEQLVIRIARQPLPRPGARTERRLERLKNAEVVIENMQRLSGFELELRAMRLSFDNWEHLVSADALTQHGLALIVDQEALRGPV